MELRRIDDELWEVEAGGRTDLRVAARVFADAELLEAIRADDSLVQLQNVATLPGIIEPALAMPDIHQGYGFPVGGVAATELPDGVISPGGVGYDINCGVRLLAAPFSGPYLRPDRVRWVRVDAVEPTAGQLLVGWFASRLGWELDEVRQAGDELGAGYRTPAGTCQVRVVAAIGSSNLTRVHLELDTADGPASVRVEAPPGHLVATVEVPGQPTTRRKVGRGPGPATGPAGLGQELQMFGRDRVFEDALAAAAALVAS